MKWLIFLLIILTHFLIGLMPSSVPSVKMNGIGAWGMKAQIRQDAIKKTSNETSVPEWCFGKHIICDYRVWSNNPDGYRF